MITVIVTFSIPSEVSASILEEKFLETAPMYLETPGLVRKNYLYDRATLEAGGCYTFQDKKSADLWFNEERIAWLTERYSAPEIRYFETPVIVNPDSGLIENPGY